MSAKPKGHTAVMASRVEPPDSLDFFCTPPWGTRALCELVLGKSQFLGRSVWDPCAGEGHMAEVLREYFADVHASDVHDYGRGYEVGSFVGVGPDVAPGPGGVDWLVMNPPFNLAIEFVKRALEEASRGVAILVRSAWFESEERYEELFRFKPPTTVAVFAERVPMAKGRWDPNGSTATSYAWFIWIHGERGPTRLTWIPPGQKHALERPDDRRRFAMKPAVGQEVLPI